MASAEGASPAAVAKWIDTLNGSVIPIKPRMALRDLVLQREINGRALSMVLNSHALTDFNVADLSLANATKIRKCWHSDFPDSVGIKAAGSVSGEQSQRHDACQDGADYSGYEGYAGYKTGPGTGTRTTGLSNNRGSPGSPGVQGGGAGRGGFPNKPPAFATMRGPQAAVTISLEVMRAALDSVAERSDLNRQEMYLGLRDVISDEVWKPLWDSYTTDLVRERQCDEQSSSSPKSRSHSNPLRPPKKVHSPQQSGKATRMEGSPGRNHAHPSRGHEAHSNSPQDFHSPQDELAHLPELRSSLRLGQQQPVPDFQSFERTFRPGQDFQCDDDARSQAETLRSEAETMVSDSMSQWLGTTTANRARLSPFELANWLRMLPKDRLDGDMLKAVARQVLDKEINEDALEDIIAKGGFASLGVTDQRQAKVLERYFKQRQEEAAMKEAAIQTGALNRQFNAKLEAKAFVC